MKVESFSTIFSLAQPAQVLACSAAASAFSAADACFVACSPVSLANTKAHVDTKPSIRHSRNSLRPSMITAAVYHNLNSKKTHTQNSSCNNPSSNPPKKHKPKLRFAKPLAFYKTQNLPLQSRLLHRCIKILSYNNKKGTHSN